MLALRAGLCCIACTEFQVTAMGQGGELTGMGNFITVPQQERELVAVHGSEDRVEEQ